MAFRVDNNVIREYCAALGVPVSNDHLRLFGLRGARPYNTRVSLTANRLDDWDDTIGIWGGEWFMTLGTVDPGAYYTTNPTNGGGAAHLLSIERTKKPWHFVWGSHHGEYKCLVQGEPFTVCRDTNRDGSAGSKEPLATGYFGVQIHHGGLGAHVSNWSAGCNVIQDPERFDTFIQKLEASGQNRFEYFLLDAHALAQHRGLIP